MRFLDAIRLRLRALTRGDAVDAELSGHLQQLIDENVAAGMRADDARLAALRISTRRLNENAPPGRHVFEMRGRTTREY